MQIKAKTFLRIVFLFCMLLSAGCKASGPELNPTPLDSTPRLLVMSAFDAELSKLRSHTAVTATYEINGRTVSVGQLAGKNVVLLLSGESMVNAAMTVQAALDRFNVIGIVFSGIAGGINPDLAIGDVTVPAQWGEYQEQLFARQTAQGWSTTGFSQDFGNFEGMFPQPVTVTQSGDTPDNPKKQFWFPVSPVMLATAKDIANQVSLSKCILVVCLGSEPKVVVGGNGVSGPTFVDNAQYRDWVWQTFHADAVDMESAAVAHVAYTNNVPFIVFRSLSDLAGGGSGANEIATFFLLAANNSANVVEAFLGKLPE
jgi:adenosylhomocysteine nucleosidase